MAMEIMNEQHHNKDGGVYVFFNNLSNGKHVLAKT